MKLSELITELQRHLEAHGDSSVVVPENWTSRIEYEYAQPLTYVGLLRHADVSDCEWDESAVLVSLEHL